jgi:hypothetical protein
MAPFDFLSSKGSDGRKSLESPERPFPPELDEEKKDDRDTNQNLDVYSSDGDSIASGQDGVKKAQATTIVWSRNAIIFAYALYVTSPGLQ